MEEEKKGFVVKDRRIFDESGKSREEEIIKTEPEEQKAPAPEEKREEESRKEEYIPEINFANFVISLSTSALFHFGDFPDPATGKAEKNLIAAKQIIDTLSMLKNKTEGNLDANEKNLIEGVLFELQMRYVKEKT